MAASSFTVALARVLRHEGGYSNHPADPGGPTMRGVVQRVYDAHRASKGLPRRSVREIDTAELTEIYRRQYWDAVRGDELPVGLDYCVFDAAVNSGPGQAAKWLQRALALTADGQIGAVTLRAAQDAADKVAVIDDVCARRLAMLKALKTWPVFGTGWGRRVADVRRDAAAMVRGEAPPPAPPVALVGRAGGDEGGAKAQPSDRSMASILRTPESLAGGVAVATAALNAAADPGPMQWALAVAVVAAVAVAAYVFVRRVRAA